jgi:hypothetical protein
MKTPVAVLVLLVASGRDLAATPLQGAPQRNAPCRDCWLAVPQHPVGLLVVLHGDDAGASSAFLDWRDARAGYRMSSSPITGVSRGPVVVDVKSMHRARSK